MKQDVLKLQIELLQQQINKELSKYAETLKEDLPFHVLKKLQEKILELNKTIERLKE